MSTIVASHEEPLEVSVVMLCLNESETLLLCIQEAKAAIENAVEAFARFTVIAVTGLVATTIISLSFGMGYRLRACSVGIQAALHSLWRLFLYRLLPINSTFTFSGHHQS